MRNYVLLFMVLFSLTAFNARTSAQTCTPSTPVCVPANGYAFQYFADTDYGLKFNTSTAEYQFTNAAGVGLFNIHANNGLVTVTEDLQVDNKVGIGSGNPMAVDFSVFDGVGHFGVPAGYAQFDNDGDLEFIGTADYLVGGNRYAFRYKAAPGYGLFFNETDSRYEFRTNNATAVSHIDANTGDGYFKGNLKVGTNSSNARVTAASTTKGYQANVTSGAGTNTTYGFFTATTGAGSSYGAYLDGSGSTPGPNYGAYGRGDNSSPSGSAYGVYGTVSGTSPFRAGVYGVDNGVGPGGYAGYFDGIVNIDGDLEVSGKTTLGPGHTNNGSNSFVAGSGNVTQGNFTAITGGLGNTIDQSNTSPGTTYSFIGGGSNNYIDQAQRAVITGGLSNSISAGPPPNSASSATISGGVGNDILGNTQSATISGGNDNRITGNPTLPGTGATVGGGTGNEILNSRNGTIAGGNFNTITANYASIPGGRENTADGEYAFAAGRRAKALNTGSFVWADNTNADFASTGNNQFLLRANGGVGINTNAPTETLDVDGSAKIRSLAGEGVRTVHADSSGKLVMVEDVASASNAFTNNIPDNSCAGTLDDSLLVSGFPSSINTVDLSVTVNVQHTYVGDLQIILISPTGDVLTLLDQDLGSSDDLVNTTFADGGSTISGDTPPFSDCYNANGSLDSICAYKPTVANFASINGGSIDPNGIWVLKVFDQAGADTGALTSWSLDLSNSSEFGIPNYVPKWNKGTLTKTSSIYDNGNVGINTTDPNTKLEVVETNSDNIATAKFSGVFGPTNAYLGAQGKTDYDGDASLDIFGQEIGVLGVSTGSSSTDNTGVFGHSNGWGGRFQNTDGTTISNAISVGGPTHEMEASDGEINTTSNFTVRTAGVDDANLIQLGNSDDSHYMRLFGGRLNDPNPFILWKDGDPMRFATDAGGFSELMRINSNGNVGIGTPSPSAKLEVIGNLRVTDKANIGPGNTNSGTHAFVNGSSNTNDQEFATITGGLGNTITIIGRRSGIFTGWQNTLNGDQNVIVGGESNLINLGKGCFIGSGNNNTIQTSDWTFIGGGANNSMTVQTEWSFIGGGSGNTINNFGKYSVIPGGRDNTVSAEYGFAAGRRAKALHTGSFVWADNTNADFATTGNNQFLIRAAGGVGIGINNPAFLLQLSLNSAAKPTSSSWTVVSDQNLKTNVAAFEDGLDLINKIDPVWFSYNGKAGMPTDERGVGTIAQDLKKVAPYMVKDWTYEDDEGASENYLAVDYGALDFVLINAIKEQQAQIEELAAAEDQTEEIEQLKNENAEMKDRLTKIEQMLVQFDMSLDECCSNHQQQGNSVPAFDQPSLGQNVPNPFESSTIIPYYIPDNTESAYMIVNNIDGKELRNYPIDQFGLGKVTFKTQDLSAGTYMYTLFVNGEIVDSKLMIIN